MMKNVINLKKWNYYGITKCKELIYNPSYKRLFLEEINNKNIKNNFDNITVTSSGAVAIDTGIFTGRSPLDRYILYDNNTCNKLWWSDENKWPNDNHPISKNIWDYLKNLVCKQLSNKRIFIIDAFCGSNKNSRIKVRFITEIAWQAHFIKNMFIRPTKKNLKNFIPDFVVLNGSRCTNPKWREQNMHSENFIAFNLTERMQIIGGTSYCGEMKKGLFSIMNYLLPQKGIASMHCSANTNKYGEVALFFGLSGTGKTTLSTNNNRFLIGDDEHGWDNNGIFNLEGGCYAKTNKLSFENEPEIYKAIKRNALLENVTVMKNGCIDFNNIKKTENARVSYPIYHIKNVVKSKSLSGHAKIIILLTADAFGVFPPVASLSINQMQYYFLSGFTTKISGTEREIFSSKPTFSSCFGEAFLLLHPIIYSNLLVKRALKYKSRIFLINTGWNGKGVRISIKDTKSIINAILTKKLNNVPTRIIPIFNLHVPIKIHGIKNKILNPYSSYNTFDEWKIKAKKLAKLFINNFNKFKGTKDWNSLINSGPKY